VGSATHAPTSETKASFASAACIGVRAAEGTVVRAGESSVFAEPHVIGRGTRGPRDRSVALDEQGARA
jgi:hypothetical protein